MTCMAPSAAGLYASSKCGRSSGKIGTQQTPSPSRCSFLELTTRKRPRSTIKLVQDALHPFSVRCQFLNLLLQLFEFQRANHHRNVYFRWDFVFPSSLASAEE